MDKTALKNLAEKAIPLLRKMFGDGVDFECTEYFKTNEALIGVALKLPGCSSIPMLCLEDLPDDTSAEDVAYMAATTFQEALHNYKALPAFPEMSREFVLENVVLQALSRKRNRQMLRAHPHILYLDLAGIFRVPIGPFEKNSLNTALITNQIMENLGLTVDELAEAARRNTVSKFGIEFVNAQRMALASLMRRPWTPEPFEAASMTDPGLYTLTNSIHINGAALILLPDVLDKIGEKAGMDYFIIPSSIHEVLIAKDDGQLTANELRKLIYDGNRNGAMIQNEDVLSDKIYFYSRKTKELKVV